MVRSYKKILQHTPAPLERGINFWFYFTFLLTMHTGEGIFIINYISNIPLSRGVGGVTSTLL